MVLLVYFHYSAYFEVLLAKILGHKSHILEFFDRGTGFNETWEVSPIVLT